MAPTSPRVHSPPPPWTPSQPASIELQRNLWTPPGRWQHRASPGWHARVAGARLAGPGTPLTSRRPGGPRDLSRVPPAPARPRAPPPWRRRSSGCLARRRRPYGPCAPRPCRASTPRACRTWSRTGGSAAHGRSSNAASRTHRREVPGARPPRAPSLEDCRAARDIPRPWAQIPGARSWPRRRIHTRAGRPTETYRRHERVP